MVTALSGLVKYISQSVRPALRHFPVSMASSIFKPIHALPWTRRAKFLPMIPSLWRPLSRNMHSEKPPQRNGYTLVLSDSNPISMMSDHDHYKRVCSSNHIEIPSGSNTEGLRELLNGMQHEGFCTHLTLTFYNETVRSSGQKHNIKYVNLGDLVALEKNLAQLPSPDASVWDGQVEVDSWSCEKVPLNSETIGLILGLIKTNNPKLGIMIDLHRQLL